MCEAKTELLKINPADYAARLTTTLNRLRDADACTESYRKLVKGLGGVSFDHNESINLLQILEINGTADCLWALCATAENSNKIGRLMAADIAESVLAIYQKSYPNDNRPRDAIQAAREFALGKISGAARAAASEAARDAAWAAASAAARAAASDAAWAAASAAAWAAARDAAWAAARDATRDAAWDAAWDAKQKLYRGWFNEMIEAAFAAQKAAAKKEVKL